MGLRLTDCVFIVTGGARGLGRANADALVAEGARVVLSGRSSGTLDEAVSALNVSAGRDAAVSVVADNADREAPARLLAAARETWGRVDGALISVGGPPKGPVTDITDEQCSAAFESVFLGAVRRARARHSPAGGRLAGPRAVLERTCAAARSDRHRAGRRARCLDGGLRRRPQGRAVAAFLLSPAASFLTGVMLPVDGGLLRTL